ncbi:zinc finger BED domain-containing protein RICESLEEPER 2-like [Olea europaea var. sylvestris]|uniref:zinc finger BED domain-containing protein RICESLEEPER 2-like n=1 Tax=Olea europaea var. sylvestris TaxID=158386 RepID=UPI000C1D0797|nr:zinc finger BED domain-containing protein RICESLEEPER 2-like [Olea europaea var. sylvestris]
MVILREYPLSMVDHIEFREFLHDLQQLFKVSFRNTLKSDILKIYEYERAKNMIALEKIESQISITTDMWTSSNEKRGFMVIIAHFIDDAWKLQSRIMRFIYVSCPHIADVLSETLLSTLMDWNIDRKLLTLTVDNCTTNDTMISIVLSQLCTRSLAPNGEFFHMKCYAHILNLIVKDVLDIISGSVKKICDSVAYWTATPKRSENFELFARQLKIDCEKKLVLDCKTSWNSTYLMLRALIYNDVFSLLKQRES